MSNSSATKQSGRWWRWLRDLLLLLIVIAVVQWWQSRSLVRDQAPPLVGHLLDGQAYQLEAGRGPYLVHFWATWCPVCRLEQGSIASLATSLPVVTVATTSGTADEVTAYLREQDIVLPVLLDEEGDIARQWGVNGVPASFVVNTDGTIAYAGKGYSTELGLRLRLWLAD